MQIFDKIKPIGIVGHSPLFFCNSGCQVHGSRLIALRFSSYFLGDLKFASDLCALAPGVLQKLEELCIRFRIEPVFHQSNREPAGGGQALNVEPEQLHLFQFKSKGVRP